MFPLFFAKSVAYVTSVHDLKTVSEFVPGERSFGTIMIEYTVQLLNFLIIMFPYLTVVSSFMPWGTISEESQKGVIAIQRCFVENQTGAIAVRSLWR